MGGGDQPQWLPLCLPAVPGTIANAVYAASNHNIASLDGRNDFRQPSLPRDLIRDNFNTVLQWTIPFDVYLSSYSTLL